jgi:hypothetical protein
MKRFTAAILLVLTILAPFASLAQTEYQNIAELREQTLTNWTQSYETKWRTVEIDAAVKVPSVDAIPIVKVVYDVPSTGPTAAEIGWEDVEYRCDALLLYNGWKQAPKSKDGKRVNQNAEAVETWRSGVTPEGKYVPMSDITYGEICAIIQENLSTFEYDPGQFELESPTELWAQHWFLYGYKKDVFPGHILFEVRQKMNGMPILQHIQQAVWNPDPYSFQPRSDELGTRFSLSAGYEGYSEELSHLYVSAAKPIETLAEDVPLCSFDKVIAAIEPGIEAGHIRKIYEVELGYVVYNEPGVYFTVPEKSLEYDEFTAKQAAAFTSANYYLRPMWQVNCLRVESPGEKLRETASYTTDERNTVDYEQLLVDAQTGELVQGSAALDRSEFKGFIPWDEVNR